MRAFVFWGHSGRSQGGEGDCPIGRHVTSENFITIEVSNSAIIAQHSQEQVRVTGTIVDCKRLSKIIGNNARTVTPVAPHDGSLVAIAKTKLCSSKRPGAVSTREAAPAGALVGTVVQVFPLRPRPHERRIKRDIDGSRSA